MMGMFQMLMMLMHILSKRFCEARFCNVPIQSSVIAAGSGNKALSGKMYNTGVWLYRLAYEAFPRKLFNSIVLAKEEDDWVQANLEKVDFDAFWESIISQKMYNNFLICQEKMKDGEPLQKFWMSFLKMVELLLNTIYAIRAGYSELLLECIRNVLSYKFAYGNINYARYLFAMLGNMLQLPKDFPEV